jgi:hypothetical protein
MYAIDATRIAMKMTLPSNRHFGLLFTIVFAVLSGLSFLRGGGAASWLIALSLLTGLLTLVKPTWLQPFNAAWMKFAGLLHQIVSPLVLAVIYFLVLTPFALVGRVAGRDTMQRKFDPKIYTYWITREPPGPPSESFRNQF